MVLDFGDELHVGAVDGVLLDDHATEFDDVFGAAGEGDGDLVDTVLEAEVDDVDGVVLGDGVEGDGAAR